MLRGFGGLVAHFVSKFPPIRKASFDGGDYVLGTEDEEIRDTVAQTSIIGFPHT